MASLPNPPPPPPPAHPKKRGSYNCGRCGLPKKGHVCTAGPAGGGGGGGELKPRRALSFDDAAAAQPSPEKKARVEEEEVEEAEEVEVVEEEDEEGVEVEVAGRRVPREVMVEVVRRLAPREVMAAAVVSRGWRQCARLVWRAAEELGLRVAAAAAVGLVGALLPRCPALSRLVLRMESDVDATLLACVAFSCPSLKTLEISMADNAVNRMTGDELSRFVSEKRCLSALKVDGCCNLGFLNLISSSLSTLWLSDICSLSKSVINCPNLKELSLGFTRRTNDSTDLVALMDSLGRTCPNLRNMHISSIRLCNEVVFALESANLRELCMLSLILGSKITDAAVASIVRSYSSLELLDLSGSSISDNGVGMICKALPHTLSSLLLALCSNITSCAIQFATTQLPLLRLMDCGMSLCVNLQPEEGRTHFGEFTGGIRYCQKLSILRKQPIYRKLIIKHGNLRKLSLWGCSAIDALYVNCPELNDLNLNSCTNLHPERLLLQCPNLKDVHASGCQDMLIGAIRNQVLNEFAAAEHRPPSKRLADGSKRVQVPYFLPQQQSEEEKWMGLRRTQCTVHVD